MARLRLFGPAREAAATGTASVDGSDVDGVLAEARRRYGPGFAAVLATSQVWVNGEVADGGRAVVDTDEVAVIPPVSGG